MAWIGSTLLSLQKIGTPDDGALCVPRSGTRLEMSSPVMREVKKLCQANEPQPDNWRLAGDLHVGPFVATACVLCCLDSKQQASLVAILIPGQKQAPELCHTRLTPRICPALHDQRCQT